MKQVYKEPVFCYILNYMKKLYCFRCTNFKDYMKTNGWDDSNPPPKDVACIEIVCNVQVQEYYGKNFAERDMQWFTKPLDNVLVTTFDDITEDMRKIGDDEYAYGMTVEQGKEIVKFINDHKDCNWFIRCHAGKSRSKAVTMYIHDIVSPDTEWELNPDNSELDYNVINGRVFSILKNIMQGYI